MSLQNPTSEGKNERRRQMHSKNLKVIVWLGLLVLCLSSIAWSQNPMLPKTGKKKTASEGTENISLPKDLKATQIDHLIAGLSDEQVRRLLINELKAQAEQETTVAAKPQGIAGFIDKIKNLTALLQARIEFLRTGGSAAPQQVGGIYTLLGKGERGTKSVAGVIVSVAAVLAGALLIEWLFVLYTAASRRRITSSVPSGWMCQNRGPVPAGFAGFYRHRHFHCRGRNHFFPFSGSHRRPARPFGRLPHRPGIRSGRLPCIAVFPGPAYRGAAVSAVQRRDSVVSAPLAHGADRCYLPGQCDQRCDWPGGRH